MLEKRGLSKCARALTHCASSAICDVVNLFLLHIVLTIIFHYVTGLDVSYHSVSVLVDFSCWVWRGATKETMMVGIFGHGEMVYFWTCSSTWMYSIVLSA